VGIGSGLNLPYYDAGRVERLWGLEPSAEMIALAREAARRAEFEVEFIGLPGDEIPLEDDSVDSVVVTYTLCTIPETEPALRQMARVLRPGGELIFCEHGLAPDAGVRRWQSRIDPIWHRCAGGCHLDRAIPELIEQAGFTIRQLQTMYLPGWRPATFNYWGTAAQG
jgi:ubiquinone/menaquinone biosynthesis C-methylase UbiE